jgi:hypothetical protein
MVSADRPLHEAETSTNSKNNSHPWSLFGTKNGYEHTAPNLDSRETAERLAGELRAKGYTDLEIIRAKDLDDLKDADADIPLEEVA